jgi:hypothetical protein
LLQVKKKFEIVLLCVFGVENADCGGMLYLCSGRLVDLPKLAVMFPFLDQSWLNNREKYIRKDKRSSKG